MFLCAGSSNENKASVFVFCLRERVILVYHFLNEYLYVGKSTNAYFSFNTANNCTQSRESRVGLGVSEWAEQHLVAVYNTQHLVAVYNTQHLVAVYNTQHLVAV